MPRLGEVATKSTIRMQERGVNSVTVSRPQDESQVQVVASQEDTQMATNINRLAINPQLDNISRPRAEGDNVGALPTPGQARQNGKRPHTDPVENPKTPATRKRPRMSRAAGLVNVSYYTPSGVSAQRDN